MRRILLLLAGAAILALPSAAAAGQQKPSHTPGFLVVRNALTDLGINGKPVATVVVHGFVLGSIAEEGRVQIYHFASGAGSLGGQAAGLDVTRRGVTWHRVQGTEFRGSHFRFRAVGGGYWRVVVYGAGVSLYAGGIRRVSLHGSTAYPRSDGVYSFNGGPFASMPTGVMKWRRGGT